MGYCKIKFFSGGEESAGPSRTVFLTMHLLLYCYFIVLFVLLNVLQEPDHQKIVRFTPTSNKIPNNLRQYKATYRPKALLEHVQPRTCARARECLV